MASFRFGRSQARPLLPTRRLDANKSHAGRALVVAGSTGMFGAGVLCASAAARIGAGYVTLLTDRARFPSGRHPDFLLADAATTNLAKLKFSAVAVGPGLGASALAMKCIRKLIALEFSAVVLDADALNQLAKERRPPKLPSTWILTPHEGELARLLNVTSRRIRADRETYVRRAQTRYGAIVLLKGPGTLIASSDRVDRNASGNPALAKAGTGDVLTGLIVGLLAQGVPARQAACVGAYVHGFLADRWIREHDELSLLASDLVADLPRALRALRLRK